MTDRVVNISKDFSTYPGGRFRRDGEFSGEAFREEILLPELKKAESDNHKVIVILDGTFGYAASFLDEAFGGLVREHSYDAKRLSRLLSIVAEAKHVKLYKELAEQYIKEATPSRRRQHA